jgi:hypothetical protein
MQLNLILLRLSFLSMAERASKSNPLVTVTDAKFRLPIRKLVIIRLIQKTGIKVGSGRVGLRTHLVLSFPFERKTN